MIPYLKTCYFTLKFVHKACYFLDGVISLGFLMFHHPSGLALAPLAEDLLSTLPVEEKCISGLPGSACDGLFSLPVDEKSIWFGLGWLAFGPRACPLGKGLTFHPACRGKAYFRAHWKIL